MKHRIFVLLLALGLQAACGGTSLPIRQPPRVGSDRDVHGCIGSAGYRWCEKTAQCERPWELAARAGFPLSTQAVETYCAVPSR